MFVMAVSGVVWSVPGVDRKLPDGDTCPEGCVYAGGWTATYEEGGESAYAYGSVSFPEPDPNNYKPYSQLTEEEVLNWVFDALGVDQVVGIQESLYQQVQEKLNPSHANGKPW